MGIVEELVSTSSHIFTTDFQNVGLAFLTVLIPFGIAVLADYFQKKDSLENYAVLDLHVILDHVLCFKTLLWAVSLVFVPLLFWEYTGEAVHWVILGSWAAGVIFLIVTLNKFYLWVKGNKLQLRLEYYKTLTDSENLLLSSRSIWEASGSDVGSDRLFFIEFLQKVKMLIEDGTTSSLGTAGDLLANFNTQVPKRGTDFFVYLVEPLPALLDLHFATWMIENKELMKGDKNTMLWHGYYRILSILNETIGQVQKIVLSKRGHINFAYFQIIKQHLEIHKIVSTEGSEGDRLYVDAFPIFEDFFTIVSALDNTHDVWEFFPKEWKVTEQNLTKNIIARKWLIEFLVWAQDEMNKNKDGYNSGLEDISRELFPEADPPSWALILTFVLRSYGESRSRSLINRETEFGYASRVFSGVFVDEQQSQMAFAEQQSAALECSIKLAVTISGWIPAFRQAFQNISKDIAELHLLEEESSADDLKVVRIRRVIQIFEKIQQLWPQPTGPQ